MIKQSREVASSNPKVNKLSQLWIELENIRVELETSELHDVAYMLEVAMFGVMDNIRTEVSDDN